MANKTFTKAEQDYIRLMFRRTVRAIADLGVGEVILFLDNREQEPKKVWPLDHSIAEKFLRFHGLPVNTTLKDYDKKYLPKLQRAEDKRMEEDEDFCTRVGLLAGN